MEATDQLESIQPIAEEQPEVPPSIPVEETEARPPKKKEAERGPPNQAGKS